MSKIDKNKSIEISDEERNKILEKLALKFNAWISTFVGLSGDKYKFAPPEIENDFDKLNINEKFSIFSNQHSQAAIADKFDYLDHTHATDFKNRVGNDFKITFTTIMKAAIDKSSLEELKNFRDSEAFNAGFSNVYQPIIHDAMEEVSQLTNNKILKLQGHDISDSLDKSKKDMQNSIPKDTIQVSAKSKNQANKNRLSSAYEEFSNFLDDRRDDISKLIKAGNEKLKNNFSNKLRESILKKYMPKRDEPPRKDNKGPNLS